MRVCGGWIGAIAIMVGASACKEAPSRATTGASASATAAGSSSGAPSGPARGAAVIAHGGAGSPAARSSQVMPAVRAAAAALPSAGALEAAIAGAVVLEDDPSFNAGTGANVRFDGVSVQMDAAVMDSSGRFGAVAVIERVKNPVRVARAVLDTPHTLLAGDGATAFARALGFADYDPTTADARARREKAMATLSGESDAGLPPGWDRFDWKRHHDYQRKLRDGGHESSDTIGVVVRSAAGEFAGALSTGGTTLTLRGRVGDVPIRGAGLHVGPKGAVACTGNGEDIIREALARRVYERIESGQSASDAVRWGVGLFPESVAIGLVALDAQSHAAAANRSMAWAATGPDGESVAK